jgi:hypothetical protein
LALLHCLVEKALETWLAECVRCCLQLPESPALARELVDFPLLGAEMTKKESLTKVLRWEQKALRQPCPERAEFVRTLALESLSRHFHQLHL